MLRSAADHYRAQQRLIAVTAAAIRREWDSIGADFDAADRLDQHHGAIGDPHGAVDLADEVQEAGRVQQVELDTLPLDGRNAGRDGTVARDLFFLKVQMGRTIQDAAHARNRPRLEEKALHQGRLAGPVVRDKGDVAYLSGLIFLHDV